MTEVRRCNKCGEEKPATVEFFYARKNRPLGIHGGKCRECVKTEKRVYAEQYRAANVDNPLFHERQRRCKQRPEYMAGRRQYEKDRRPISREQERGRRIRSPEQWRVKSQKQRAKRAQAEGSFTKQDIAALFRVQAGKCFYCDCTVGRKAAAWEIDHFIPLSRGGSNYPENLRLACKGCNRRKHARLPHEFMPDRFPPPDQQAAD